MRNVQNKNQLLIMILAVGFLIGILYENIAIRNGLGRIQIEMQAVQVEKLKYLFYILKTRLLPFLLFGLLWNFRWRKAVLYVIIAWSGVILGRTIVSAVVQYGGKGLLLFAALIIPHYLFYFLAYGIVIVFLCGKRRTQWNRIKTIAVLCMFIAGVLSETYVNLSVLNFIMKYI